jgi:hypothetical protein
MVALLIALGFVGGLVKISFGQSTEPTLKPAWRKAKLLRLAKLRKRRITLDQAEDGAVLSREFNAPELEVEFKKIAEALKKQGVHRV